MKISDLSTVKKSTEGAWLEILDANSIPLTYVDGKETKPVRLKVIGRNSKICKSYGNKLSTLLINKQDARSVKEANDVSDQMYVATVVAWEGIDEDFSTENVQSLFDNAPYIKDQVVKFVGEDSNFL